MWASADQFADHIFHITFLCTFATISYIDADVPTETRCQQEAEVARLRIPVRRENRHVTLKVPSLRLSA